MATLIVTKDKGGVGRNTGMTVISPSEEVPDSALEAIGKGTGLDGVVLADMISAMAMHERAAARFARAAVKQTEDGGFRKMHASLADVYKERVSALETLLTKLKLPRLYVSPVARVAHYVAEHTAHVGLVAGSARKQAMELALIEVAFSLAQRSLANAETLAAIAKTAKAGNTRTLLENTVKTLTADTTALENLREVRTLAMVNAAKE
ncbi:MAG TPA: hypothetical protein VIK91_06870 [Nannocystis sp.]